MKAFFDRLRARAAIMTLDEWIVCAAALSILLPDPIVAVLTLITAIFLLIRPSSRKRIITRPSFPVALALLPILVVPSIIYGYTFGIAAGLFGWSALVILIFAGSVMSVRLFSNVLDIFLAVSVVAAVYGVYCQIMGILEIGRVGSIYENPNYYGYAIELTIIAALCQYLRKGKLIYIALLVINLACNVLCDCRTAWVAILAAVTVFALMYLRKLWILLAAGGAGIAFVFIARLIPSIGERLTFDDISHSFSNRTTYWSNAWSWFLDRPIFGSGVSSYEPLSALHGERVLAHAHSLYLDMLLDVGIVGTILFAVLAFLALKGMFARQPRERFDCFNCLIVAVLVATALHGITDAPIVGVSTALMFVLMLSGAQASNYSRLRTRDAA